MGPLALIQEPGRAEVGGEYKEHDNRHEQSHAAFDKENDLPAVHQGALKLEQRIREEPREGSGNRIHTREEAHSQTQGKLGVHQGQVVKRRLRESGLGGAEEQAERNECPRRANGRVRHTKRAPCNERKPEVPTRTNLAADQGTDWLQGNVCRRELDKVSGLGRS